VPELEEELENEVAALSKCQSEFVVQYFGSYRRAGSNTAWIVMEYCDVGSLQDLLQYCLRPFSEDECRAILASLVAALAYLHAQALAQILSLPKLQKLTQIQQWIAWGIAALAASWLVLRVRRGRALWMGIGLVFCALVICFMAFQADLLWCPPTIPAALIAIGALLGMIVGRGSPKFVPPPSEASPS
jgi:hypothetical protein